MTAVLYQYASVRHLARVAAALDGEVSPVRMGQLRMTLRMLDRALAGDHLTRTAGDQYRRLLTARNIDAFLELAAAGVLREPEKAGRPLADASMRVVRDCLGILGEEAGVEVVLPRMWQQPPKATVPTQQQRALYRKLADMAAIGPLERDGTALTFEDRTRLLAMVAVVLDSGARSGELAGLRLPDLDQDGWVVTVRRRPQNASAVPVAVVAERAHVATSTVSRVLNGNGYASPEVVRAVHAAAEALGEGEPVVERYALREGSQVAVRRWLEVRKELVAGIDGGKSALWVTVAAARYGPPGIPLTEVGLRKAYTRGVRALNWLMAGEHGWEPLPTRLEQLRRATKVEPVTDGV